MDGALDWSAVFGFAPKPEDLAKANKDAHEDFAAQGADPPLRWCSRAKLPSVVARGAKLKDMAQALTRTVILDAGSKIEADPRRYRVIITSTGETLCKMAYGSEEFDYNFPLITALGGTRAKLEEETAALREARRFL